MASQLDSLLSRPPSPSSASAMHSICANELNTPFNEDADGEVKELCIQTIIQALECFKLRLTPLDIVLEIISAKGKYQRIKNEMLTSQNVSRLLDALSACDEGQNVLKQALEDQALVVALKHVDRETRSIVSRISDQSHHPILLGHAEIRAEHTVAPFLKAILSQVNISMMEEPRIPPEHDEQQVVVLEGTIKSNISTEDTVDALPLASNRITSPTPEPSNEESETIDSTEELGYPVAAAEDDRDVTAGDQQTDDHANEAPALSNEASIMQTFEKKGAESEQYAEHETDLPSSEIHSETTGSTRCATETIEDSGPCLLYSGPEFSGVGDDEIPRRMTLDVPREVSTDKKDEISTKETETRDDIGGVSGPELMMTLDFSPLAMTSAENTSHRTLRPAQKTAVCGEQKVRTRGKIGPHSCPHCDARFKQKASLHDHINTHTGAKPYACVHPGCNKHFSHYVTLRAHRSCHGSQDGKLRLKRARKGGQQTPTIRTQANSKYGDMSFPEYEIDELADPNALQGDSSNSSTMSTNKEAVPQPCQSSLPAPSSTVRSADSEPQMVSETRQNLLSPFIVKIRFPVNETKDLNEAPDIAGVSNHARKRKCIPDKLQNSSHSEAGLSTNTGSSKLQHFACHICTRTFLSRLSWKDHMNTHTGFKPYQCSHPGCGERFTHYHKYWHHNKKSHN